TLHTILTIVFCFFSNATPTTELYPLSLHDALPIFGHVDHVEVHERERVHANEAVELLKRRIGPAEAGMEAERLACLLQCRLQLRSEEHTSELQSLTNLVCRLLLEKKTSQNS